MTATFCDKVIKHLRSIGAKESRDGRDFLLNTEHGILRITPDRSDRLFTVFCRFDTPSLSQPALNTGPSGKWNFHDNTQGKNAVNKAFDAFVKYQLNQIELLPWPGPRHLVEKIRRRVLHKVAFRCGEFIPYPSKSKENREIRRLFAQCVRFERHAYYLSWKPGADHIPAYLRDPDEPVVVPTYDELVAQWL